MILKFFVIILAIVLSGVLSALSIPKIVQFAYDNKLYDLPSNRKLHKIPIPRLGGVCFVPAAVVTFAICCLVLMNGGSEVAAELNTEFLRQALAFVTGAVLLYVCGVIDDITSLSYKSKFVAQIAAAASLCIGGLWIDNLEHILYFDLIPIWIGVPFTILLVVYLTNAINLIDGIDGLASGLACIALTATAVLNLLAGYYIWAVLGICFLGPVVTFFYFNVFSKKYKVFMGDTGSLTLGYFMSFVLLHYWDEGLVWNPRLHNIGIIAISTLIIPMLDVIRVMMARIIAGRNPFIADKNHIHHKLLRAGLNPRCTLISILLFSLAIITLNLILADSISQTFLLMTDVLLFIGAQIVINIFIHKKERQEAEER